MKKQLVLIVLAMCMIPVLTSAIIVEYSTDNSTWTNCTFTNSTSKTGYQLFLDPGTLYYFRASNDGINWNYTTARTALDGEGSMSSFSVAVFILGTCLGLFLLPFFVRFSKSPIVNLIISRSCTVIGLWLMTLNTAIFMDIASVAGLSINTELVTYMTIFGWGGYIAILFLVLGTLFESFRMWKGAKEYRRTGWADDDDEQ